MNIQTILADLISAIESLKKHHTSPVLSAAEHDHKTNEVHALADEAVRAAKEYLDTTQYAAVADVAAPVVESMIDGSSTSSESASTQPQNPS